MNKFVKAIYFLVRLLSVFAIIWFIYSYFDSDNNNIEKNKNLIYIFNMVVLLLLSFAPNILHKKGYNVPKLLSLFYLLIVLSATFLGEVLEFYKNVNHFDSLLHFITPMFIAIISLSVIIFLNSAKTLHQLNPFFIFVVLVSITALAGVVWEIFEFLVDVVVEGSNMQRFSNSSTGELHIGQLALVDTMKDLILDLLGGLIMSFIIFIDLKRNKKLTSKLLITKIKKNTNF